jgi:hypothetical protein
MAGHEFKLKNINSMTLSASEDSLYMISSNQQLCKINI